MKSPVLGGIWESYKKTIITAFMKGFISRVRSAGIVDLKWSSPITELHSVSSSVHP